MSELERDYPTASFAARGIIYVLVLHSSVSTLTVPESYLIVVTGVAQVYYLVGRRERGERC